MDTAFAVSILSCGNHKVSGPGNALFNCTGEPKVGFNTLTVFCRECEENTAEVRFKSVANLYEFLIKFIFLNMTVQMVQLSLIHVDSFFATIILNLLGIVNLLSMIICLW